MVEWIFEISVVLILILVSPIISRVTRIPTVVLEVVMGIVIGPSLLSLVAGEGWLVTMATIGFIYLMFVVGLEIEVDYLGGGAREIAAISLASFVVPFVLGAAAAYLYGLPPLFIGVTLSTTSMGVVLPTVREVAWNKRFSQILLGSSIVVDILSMFALTYIVETLIVGRTTVTVLIAVLALFVFSVFIARRARSVRHITEKLCQSESGLGIRVSLALIFTLAAMSEITGVHAIIGAFFAGLLVSELFGGIERLLDRLLSFGYGFFIPIFFIYVGVNTDLPAIFLNLRNIEVLLVFMLVGYLAKMLGTAAASMLVGFSREESMAMGLAMSARLSLVAVAAEIGLSLGLIDSDMYSILILLAVISLVVSPSLAKYMIGRLRVKIPEEELI